MIRHELIVDSDALKALEPAWWALWGRCASAPGGRAAPFQSPAWLIAWWDTFAPGPLVAAAVWNDGDLVALAPFYLDVATRRLLPLGTGVSDVLDLLIDPADPAAFGAALVAGLAAREDWTVASFEELPPDAAALALVAPKPWRDAVAAQSVIPVVPLAPHAEGAEGVVPAPKRRKLRMARHRVARRGGRVERGDAATAPSHLEHLFRLHASRWRSRGGEGVLADPRIQRFHRAALPGLVEHELLRCAVLRIEDTVAGVFYGFRGGDTVFAYLGGFDPTFGFESPGTVLIGAAMDDALREGCHAFSFLRGQEPYKYEWGARDQPNLSRTLWRG